ncbi:MAG: hypothetical protein ACTSXC_03535 [Candidatus Freyarchaeota archaeon]
MNVDEKIELAYGLARDLAGVDHNELSKWMGFLKTKKDLSAAFNLAKHFSESPSLRPNLRKSYRLIFDVLSKNEKLKELSLVELLEIIGHTRRIIVWQSATSKMEERKGGDKRRGKR